MSVAANATAAAGGAGVAADAAVAKDARVDPVRAASVKVASVKACRGSPARAHRNPRKTASANKAPVLPSRMTIKTAARPTWKALRRVKKAPMRRRGSDVRRRRRRGRRGGRRNKHRNGDAPLNGQENNQEHGQEHDHEAQHGTRTFRR